MKLDLLTLAELRDSWLRQLRGQRKSDHTLAAYRAALNTYLAYCKEHPTEPVLTKAHVIGWIGAQHGSGTSTVRLRLTVLKLFARWLADEEGFDADPITAVKPPKLDQAPVADLSDDEIARMVKVCERPTIAHKRDKAMLLLLAETGLRAGELLALDITDINLDECWLLVRKGKGGKSRRVRFSAGAAAAADRYVRARRLAVRRPAEGPLWVSNQGNRLSHNGLVNTLKTRAATAGVIGFHVHRLRHSMSVRWLRAGGSESGLMAHAGWTDRGMIARYAKAASERLAMEEFDRLGLGLHEL
ncbi:MAG TPA: tyrosine-type recombinase/integrase [Mycobacterium sp.]|nr:tyrosine-type recombinase/integrase [Mycobacterium sp.]